MAKGKILDKVAYAIRPERKGENLAGEEIKVRDAYPYNPESKTSPQSAKNWASHGVRADEDGKPVIVERDNMPFAVTITDLCIRDRGGRAYKVIDSDSLMFDLREDQLLEILNRTGIMPGGRVPGDFVWGQLGSQMHLVLVGGELHKQLVEETEKEKSLQRREAAGLHYNERNLQVGHVYQKKDESE